MNKQLTTAFFAILIVVIALSIVFVYFFQEPLPPDPRPSPGPSPSPLPGLKPLTPEEELELQKRAAEIIKTKNFDSCTEIENELYRTVCINNIALNLAEETQDISYCQRLDDKLVSVANCERNVLLEKSLDKEDIGICDETSNSEVQKVCQDVFWQSLALEKGDSSVCEGAGEEEERNACFDIYLFNQEFLESEADFDCQKFYSQDVKEDCESFKEMLSTDEMNCGTLASSLFLDRCFLIMFSR